jgi:hypothetical protein
VALVRVYCGLASAYPPRQLAVGSSSLSATVVDDSGRVLDVCEIGDDSYGYAYLSALLAERATGPYSVAIAADRADRLVPMLLTTAGWALTIVDDESADDLTERYADDLADQPDSASAPTQRRALGLARALQAGALSATLLAPPAALAGLKPVLAAHSALATGRHAAATALREVLRELYPAALRAYPDPADPVALAVVDALPEPGMLAPSISGRSRDAAATADAVTARLAAAGVADQAAVTEAITALRVAIAETPRRSGLSRALTATVAESVRQSVAAVRACDAAGTVLVNALAERLAGTRPDRAGPTAAEAPAARQPSGPPASGAPLDQSPFDGSAFDRPTLDRSGTDRSSFQPAGAGRAAVTGRQPDQFPAAPEPAPAAPAATGRSEPPYPPAPASYPSAPAPPPYPATPAPASYPAAGPASYLSAAPASYPPAPPPASYPTAAGPAPAAPPPVAAPTAAAAAASAPPAGPARTEPATRADRVSRFEPASRSVPASRAVPPPTIRPSVPSHRATGSPAAPVSAPPPDQPQPTRSQAHNRPVSPPPPPPPGITPIVEPRSPAPGRRASRESDLDRRVSRESDLDRRASRESDLDRQRIQVPIPRPAPEWPDRVSRADWPVSPPADDDWATPREPAAGTGAAPGRRQDRGDSPAPAGSGWQSRGAVAPPDRPTGGVTPPWRADDLRPPEPPALRLVEPTLPEELRDDLGYSSPRPDPPPLRLVEPAGNGIPRSAPPVSADDDNNLLIFAQTRSAWFDQESDYSWESEMDVGWRAAEQAASPTVGDRTGAGLPRRVPHANLVPGAPPRRDDRPLRVVRDPASIAAHTSGYFSGWRRGQEVGGYPLGGRPGRQAAGAWEFHRDEDRLSG